MNYFFSLFLSMLFCVTTYGQLTLPKIDSDQTKITKSKTSIKKEYFKSGKLVLEVYYPVSKDEMDGHCGLSNGIYDSIYFYYVPNKMQYNFSKEDGNIINKWNGKLNECWSYYPTGSLCVHYKSVVNPDYFSKDPICCGRNNFYVGEYLLFNSDGDTSTYYNYTKGEFNDIPSYRQSKKISSFQLKADSLLKNNLGQDFFTKYVQRDYGQMKIDWNWPVIDVLKPPLKKGALPPDNAILGVNFSYIIYLNEFEQYDLIHVTFDQDGNFIFKIDEIKNSLTNGLVTTQIPSLLNSAEVLQVAQSIIKDKTDVYIDLIWKEDDVIDGKGSYYYQLLFNKVTKSETYSSTITFDELLIHAATKEMSKIQKFSTGIEAIGK